MSYKLGYIADRVGVPSKALQENLLMEAGVLSHDIYENLDDCIASLRDGDSLVVYTTAILGRNKINDTFKQLSSFGAHGVYSIKTKRTYLCKFNSDGIDMLAAAWDELNDVSKQQMGAVGRQLGGRKQSGIWKQQDAIRQAKIEGMTLKELSETYKASESTIRRILEANREKK